MGGLFAHNLDQYLSRVEKMKSDGVPGGDTLFDVSMLRLLKVEATRHEEGTAMHSIAMYQVTDLQAKVDRREDVTKSLEMHREKEPKYWGPWKE